MIFASTACMHYGRSSNYPQVGDVNRQHNINCLHRYTDANCRGTRHRNINTPRSMRLILCCLGPYVNQSSSVLNCLYSTPEYRQGRMGCGGIDSQCACSRYSSRERARTTEIHQNHYTKPQTLSTKCHQRARGEQITTLHLMTSVLRLPAIPPPC